MKNLVKFPIYVVLVVWMGPFAYLYVELSSGKNNADWQRSIVPFWAAVFGLVVCWWLILFCILCAPELK